ncbi:unnamed protein product [Spirodela intermedia]|uniref:Uncharacterized protein n=1 Tax=Spirodela intermedia TaxID=51605 RepID=A0A7I8KI30_SPIIN|nr:unnamed protein product [Spirodela intermedia]
MTGNSLTLEKGVFLPRRVMVLPLYRPSVKTKFMAMISPSSLCDADTYSPCALPTSLELISCPSVSGSSITYAAPKNVAEAFVLAARAICTTVGLRPLTMS